MNRLSFRLLVVLGTLALLLQATLPWAGAAVVRAFGGDAELLTAIAIFIVGFVILLVAYVSGVRSLSHHERLHAAVEQAREDYVRLFHASPEGIFSADATFAFTALNLSGARTLGAEEPSVFIRTRLPSICADPEQARELLRQLSEGASLQVTVLRIRARDGHTRWIELTCQAQRDVRGALVGIDGVFRDVTDRVDAEEKAHERFDKMQSAYLALGRANRHLSLLGDVARWQGDVELRDEEIVDGILHAAATVARAEASAAYVLEGGSARLLATTGEIELPKRRTFTVPAGLERIVKGEKRSEEVPGRATIGATLLNNRKQPFASCLVVACVTRGKTLGIVELYRQGTGIESDDEKLLHALIAQAAPSMARMAR